MSIVCVRVCVFVCVCLPSHLLDVLAGGSFALADLMVEEDFLQEAAGRNSILVKL